MIPTDIDPPEDHEPVHLTEAQVNRIAERAARKALELSMTEKHIDTLAEKVGDRFVLKFGWAALRKLAWLLGLVIVGSALWLAGKGELPK